MMSAEWHVVMVNSPNLFGFEIFLYAASIVLLLNFWSDRSALGGRKKCDSLLLERMERLGIANWKALQQKSGLKAPTLAEVRRGKIGRLTPEQLSGLADALDWTAAELRDNLRDNLGDNLVERQLADLSARVAAYTAEAEELRQQCLRLRDELQRQSSQLSADFRNGTFEQLQTLLTNYPSVRSLAKAKPDLPAKNLVSLFAPLENLLESWGYQAIGSPWEKVAYDPQLHQPDTGDMAAGELVYIRFVGYRDGDRILCPAKVSRTLPAAIERV